MEFRFLILLLALLGLSLLLYYLVLGMGIVGLLTSTTGLISGLTNFGLGTSAVKNIAEAIGTKNEIRIATVVKVMRRLVWFTGILGALITFIAFLG